MKKKITFSVFTSGIIFFFHLNFIHQQELSLFLAQLGWNLFCSLNLFVLINICKHLRSKKKKNGENVVKVTYHIFAEKNKDKIDININWDFFFLTTIKFPFFSSYFFCLLSIGKHHFMNFQLFGNLDL